MPRSISTLLVLVLFAGACVSAARGQAPAPAGGFRLNDGDRVVLLGSTFIERDQSHGYLEAALASRFCAANVQFRNLGWSGDNVFGEARAGFGKVEDGFAALKKHVESLAPTVILLAYGANESFAGADGLPSFLAGLDTLLKTLDATGARIVFVLSPPHEDLGRPLPEPTQQNKNLKLYGDAIAKVAAARGALVVNLFDLLGKQLLPAAGGPLTDNGIHLTDYGYWRAAAAIERGLDLAEPEWQVEIDAKASNITARGTYLRQARFSPEAISFAALDQQLPLPPAPDGSPEVSRQVRPRVLRVFDLPAGEYTLAIDGKDVASGNARQWSDGVTLLAGAELEQAEQLRTTILDKNQLYFHRWRPQNETYLFGFRKYEQGNNAVEIPQFDPLVAEREATIRSLCVPVEHHYQLKRAAAK